MNAYILLYSFLPYLIPASEDGESGPDLSTLRTFRVLRPLKLVSGVPSELKTDAKTTFFKTKSV